MYTQEGETRYIRKMITFYTSYMFVFTKMNTYIFYRYDMRKCLHTCTHVYIYVYIEKYIYSYIIHIFIYTTYFDTFFG